MPEEENEYTFSDEDPAVDPFAGSEGSSAPYPPVASGEFAGDDPFAASDESPSPPPLELAGEASGMKPLPRGEPRHPSDPFAATVDEVSPLAGGIPSPSVPGTGNRPAAGARHARPGEILGDHFQGSEAAGDFLGLDVEMLSDMEPPSEGPLELDLATAPGTATGTLAEDEVGYAEEGGVHELLDPATAPLPPELDPTAGELEDEEYDEFDEEDLDGAPSTRRRVVLLAGGAFALGLAAVAAVIYLPDFVGTGPVVLPPAGGGGATRVATADNPGTTAMDPSTTDPLVGPEDPAVDALVGPEGSDPLSVDPVFVDPAGADPVVAEVEEPVFDPTPVDDGNPVGTTPGDVEPPVDPVADGGGLTAGLLTSPAALAFDPSLLEQLKDLPPGELEMIWRGAEVPMEALGASVRILTPRVGSVRIIMKSDALFDGKLLAMGQNKVWIDTNMGQMGLAADRIARIERLVGEPAGVHETVAVARGDRVRVHTLGGVLTGRVLSAKEGTVVLMTDGGGRVTLQNPNIETIGSSRAIVVEQ